MLRRFKAKGKWVSFKTKKKGAKKAKRRTPPRRKNGTFRKRR
jgi:hypothetical protein